MPAPASEKPKIRVLHADDEFIMRDLVREILIEEGNFEIHSYATGQEVLDAAKTLKPDLLLLDMMMPGMTGLQTLKEVQKIETLSHIPAVFLTSRVSPEEIEAYYRAGAVGVLNKSSAFETLGKDVFSCWNAHRIVNLGNTGAAGED